MRKKALYLGKLMMVIVVSLASCTMKPDYNLSSPLASPSGALTPEVSDVNPSVFDTSKVYLILNGKPFRLLSGHMADLREVLPSSNVVEHRNSQGYRILESSGLKITFVENPDEIKRNWPTMFRDLWTGDITEIVISSAMYPIWGDGRVGDNLSDITTKYPSGRFNRVLERQADRNLRFYEYLVTLERGEIGIGFRFAINNEGRVVEIALTTEIFAN